MSGESKCRSCGALVLWVEMVPTGKKKPLDAVPTEQGTIERRRGKVSSKWFGRVVPSSERVPGSRLYVSHFATCPDAEHWRSGKPE